MPVFDFSNTTEEKKACECTYTTFQSNENTASAKYPILVLDNTAKQWKFIPAECLRTRQSAQHLSLPRKTELYVRIFSGGCPFCQSASLAGGKPINVRLSGENTPDGYAVYKSVKLPLAVEKSFPRKMAFYSL